MTVSQASYSSGDKYAQQLDASAAPIYYIGKAAVGSAFSSPVWSIYKLDNTGGSMSITWANGSDNYVNAWTNRASLSYS